MTASSTERAGFRWLPYPQIMESMDWYGAEHWGPCYGNFWSRRPCRILPHRWTLLRVTDVAEGWPRAIRRCRRCGSQIHTNINYESPQRGTI